jgi:hypothetical protein
MRVLMIHNSYQQAGGEGISTQMETGVLREHGHEVVAMTATNHIIDGFRAKVETAWNAPYSRGAREECAAIMRDARPDLAYAQNLFPLTTPTVLSGVVSRFRSGFWNCYMPQEPKDVGYNSPPLHSAYYRRGTGLRRGRSLGGKAGGQAQLLPRRG